MAKGKDKGKDNGHVSISDPGGADPEDGCGDGGNAGRGPPPRTGGGRTMLTVTNNLATHLVIPGGMVTGKSLILTPKGTVQVEASTGPLRDAERNGHVTIHDSGGARAPEDDSVRKVPAAGRTGRTGRDRCPERVTRAVGGENVFAPPANRRWKWPKAERRKPRDVQ